MSQLPMFGESLSKMDGNLILPIWKRHRSLLRQTILAATPTIREKITSNVLAIKDSDFSFIDRAHYNLAAQSIASYRDQARLKMDYGIKRKVIPLIQIFGFYCQVVYVLVMLMIASAILTGLSTRGLMISMVVLLGSFVCLCAYHRKRIYIQMVFRDSLKFKELDRVVAECNNRFMEKIIIDSHDSFQSE